MELYFLIAFAILAVASFICLRLADKNLEEARQINDETIKMLENGGVVEGDEWKYDDN